MPRRDNSGEYELPRKKSKTPVWVILLVAIVPVGVVCSGCAGLAMWGRTLPAQPEKEYLPQMKAGEEFKIGDLGVTIVDCVERRVDSTSPSGTQMQSDQPNTVISIRLRNYNPAKNATLQGQSGYAVVTDDLGNELVRMHMTTEFGFRCRVHGQIEDGKGLELRSDEIGHDKVIVARTVPAAKSVTVKLDLTRYGGKGFAVATLPVSKSH